MTLFRDQENFSDLGCTRGCAQPKTRKLPMAQGLGCDWGPGSKVETAYLSKTDEIARSGNVEVQKKLLIASKNLQKGL